MCDHPRFVSTPHASPHRWVATIRAPKNSHPADARTLRRNPRTLSQPPREEPASCGALDRSRSAQRSTYTLFHVTTRRRFHELLSWIAVSFDSFVRPGTQSRHPKMRSSGDTTCHHRTEISSPASPRRQGRSLDAHPETEAPRSAPKPKLRSAVPTRPPPRLIATLAEIERPPLPTYDSATIRLPEQAPRGASYGPALPVPRAKPR
jgi:hypothetical protein